jgi:hypothetical protein
MTFECGDVISMSYDSPDRTNYFYDSGRASRLSKGDNGFFTTRLSSVIGGGFISSVHKINGNSYKIMASVSDQDAGNKKMSIHEAIRLVTNAGFKLPTDTRFILGSDMAFWNQAFPFNQGLPVCWISVGPSSIVGGSGRGISKDVTPGFASATKIILHELGHVLHAHNVGINRFYVDPRLKKGNNAIGSQVSGYAADNNAREIVAETFLGTMIGREYGNDVMQYYALRGGPRIMNGFGSLR